MCGRFFVKLVGVIRQPCSPRDAAALLGALADVCTTAISMGEAFELFTPTCWNCGKKGYDIKVRVNCYSCGYLISHSDYETTLIRPASTLYDTHPFPPAQVCSCRMVRMCSNSCRSAALAKGHSTVHGAGGISAYKPYTAAVRNRSVLVAGCSSQTIWFVLCAWTSSECAWRTKHG